MKQFLLKLNTHAIANAGLAFLLPVAGVIVFPEQMKQFLDMLHIHMTPIQIALACSFVSSFLHRYGRPETVK